MSKTTISGKMLRHLSPEDIEKAARSDPNARPLSDADIKRMNKTFDGFELAAHWNREAEARVQSPRAKYRRGQREKYPTSQTDTRLDTDLN